MSKAKRKLQKLINNRQNTFKLTDLPEVKTQIEKDAVRLANLINLPLELNEPIYANDAANNISMIALPQDKIREIFSAFIEFYPLEKRNDVAQDLEKSRFVLIRVIDAVETV